MDQHLHLDDQLAIMDLTPVQNPVMSRAKIPAEILCMVVEIVLAQEVATSFFDLRVVSKQFNSLVTPLLYRHIILNKRIIVSLVSHQATLSPHKLQVAHDIREYTWHVTLQGDFPEEHLGSVFGSLKHLREVTIGWPRTLWPYPVINLIRRRPKLRLNLTRQELDMSSGLLLSIINPAQLNSCHIVNYSQSSEEWSPVQKFLLGKENLAVLHLTCTGPGVVIPDDVIHPYERMPAVKELVLDGYMWNHSPANAVRFWNWSRITHLELRRVPIIPFLATVTPEHLIHLRTFKTDGFNPEILFKFEGCEFLIRLLHGIKALENLSISLHIDRINEALKENLVRAISRHGKSLRSLEFGEQKEDTSPLLMHVPTHPTQMNYVAELKSWLTNVVELSLDTTTIEVEKQLYLSSDSEVQGPADIDYANLFAGFRNLRRLKLCMKLRDINKIHDAESMIQGTQAAARAWLFRMLERKEGAMFESIFVRVEIFCDVSPNRNSILQRRVALLSYEYEGDLSFKEYLTTGI